MGSLKSQILDALGGFPSLRLLIGPLDELLSNEASTAIEWFGVPAGTILFREGDSAPDAFILLSGRLGVFIGDDPSSTPIATIPAGEFVGEMGLISEEPRSATVIALRDSDLLRLPKDTVQQLIKSHAAVATCILQLLTARLRHTSRTRELAQAMQAIAVVPLTSLIDAQFVGQFVKSLGKLFPRVEVVTRELAAREPELQRSIGTDHALLVYVADAPQSAWARHCIRQSDHVTFVVNARTTPSEQARDAIAFTAKLHRTTDLVLLNRREAVLASGATSWLPSFPSERILHVRAGNGADYDRIARLSCRRGVGLVFSGGGARAFAHVGVVKAFVDAAIPIDLVGGTSMGSIVASLVALELGPEAIADKMRYAFVENNPYNDYTLPFVSLARGRKMKRLLREHCGDLIVEDLWKTFFCISANLSTGEAMVHRTGPLWRALRASVGIPGIYPPWIENGDILVDGGIMLNFPTTTMAALRRGPVIGVEVAPENTFRAIATEIEDKSLFWLFLNGRQQVPSIVRMLMRSSIVNGEAQAAAGRAAADILIRPDVGSIPMLPFKAFDKAIEAGYRAGMDAIPQLKRVIANANVGADANV